MIGVVVVSHSPALARAALGLAEQMTRGAGPAVRIAAGAGVDEDGEVIGTDAARVAEAIREVAGPDGVLVVMDLGSAVLSAELALELLGDLGAPVRLSPAPFVEGLVAALVRAAGGASLAEVAEEAEGALAAKAVQLGAQPAPDAGAAGAQAAGSPAAGSPAATGAEDDAEPALTADVVLADPAGLHARPVAELVRRLAGLDARVTAANPRTGRGPVRADSTIALMTLGAVQGDTVRFAATGAQAAAALAAVRSLAAD
ncbi:MAG: HPr family phosphocarrier protein [Microbacteriaceae bacterium]